MKAIATEVYLAYSLNKMPDEALNPSDRHTIVVESRAGVLASVNGVFMMCHPEGEIDCPYDRMTNEEVMNSILVITADSFHESMKKRGYSRDSKTIAAHRSPARFLAQILTHETLHLVLLQLNEDRASRQLDFLRFTIK